MHTGLPRTSYRRPRLFGPRIPRPVLSSLLAPVLSSLLAPVLSSLLPPGIVREARFDGTIVCSSVGGGSQVRRRCGRFGGDGVECGDGWRRATPSGEVECVAQS
ncbi:hypothetical protein T484DRAFT_1974641, partial [Baffinella frigidus]